MSVRKADLFITDVERQFEWYALNVNWEVAERYLDVVEATFLFIEKHPLIGPLGGFTHPRIRSWRFLVVFRPFNKHILFYEVKDNEILMRRAMHGHRDLPKRLLD